MLLAAGATCAAAADPAVAAACDATEFATTLAPVADAAMMPARAIALSQSWIRWPGAPAQGRYVLVSSARGALVARVGEAVGGADDVLPLEASVDAPPAALAQRFKYVGAGALLHAGEPARVTRALRGQAFVVREDEQGRVLEATALQLAGALDDAYAAAATLADLGATRTPQGLRLAVWAPTAQAVRACVYPDAEGRASALVEMARDDASGAWHGAVAASRPGRYYSYLVDVFVPGTGLVRNRVTDPYSVSLTADSRRSWLGTLASPIEKSRRCSS